MILGFMSAHLFDAAVYFKLYSSFNDKRDFYPSNMVLLDYIPSTASNIVLSALGYLKIYFMLEILGI